MKKGICILLMLSFFSASAQSGTAITYHIKSINSHTNSLGKLRLVYNDSFAFCYIKSMKKDTLDDAKLFSKYLIHHAIFTDKKNQIRYSESNFKTSGIYVDSFKIPEWQLVLQTKKILGYDCKGAISVSASNDTTLIWYNEKLGKGAGFSNINFNLGIPLEILEQHFNFRYVAFKIDRGDFKFNLPKAQILKPVKSLQKAETD